MSPLDSAIEKGLNGNADLYGLVKSSEIVEHLQSYFINFKKRVTNSKHFFNFWHNLSNTRNRSEAIHNGELKITQHFLKNGFTMNYFHDLHQSDKKKSIFNNARNLVYNHNLPFIKTKAVRG